MIACTTAAMASATTPSNHQWLAVATTTTTVRARWAANSQRHRLVLTATPKAAMIPAQRTWIDGIAASWPAMPDPFGPYIDCPYCRPVSTNPSSGTSLGGATGTRWISTLARVVAATVRHAR